MTSWTMARRITTAGVDLDGDLTLPGHAGGLVLFAHGTGSSRHSPRNRAVAGALNRRGQATLLVDLLTSGEEHADARTGQLRFDIGLLTDRLIGIIDWLREQPDTAALPIGLFGASTGAAAALVAAAARPGCVRAVVSRGGRPDLAGPALLQVAAPTLLIVGERDRQVRDLNEQARNSMQVSAELRIIPTATHLFAEPGTLDQVAEQAAHWFGTHLTAGAGRGSDDTQDGTMIFADRGEAGRALAEQVARQLPASGGPDRAFVLALPRGGVPVAGPVAEKLGADLDIVLVRKIGAPGRPESGVGAIAEDGPPVFDDIALRYLNITEDDLSDTVAAERAELNRRRHRYRADRPAPSVTGRVVVLVDDGLATGVTARAALRWLRIQRPHRLIMAVPVCSRPARDVLADDTDTVICLHAPDNFSAVGQWYTDFGQLTDADIDAALDRQHRAASR